MNTAILKKVIDELNLKDPRLDYVRGMLETLVAIQTVNEIPEILTSPSLDKDALLVTKGTPMRVNGELNNEAAMLDARARQAIEAIKLTETVE